MYMQTIFTEQNFQHMKTEPLSCVLQQLNPQMHKKDKIQDTYIQERTLITTWSHDRTIPAASDTGKNDSRHGKE